MIVKYNNNEYKYARILFMRNEFYIFTRIKSIVDDSFKYDSEKEWYYKQVDTVDLTDIYDVKFVVLYDSEVKNGKKEWVLGDVWFEMIEQDKVNIAMKSSIPYAGWEMADRNIFTKWIYNHEIEGAKIRFYYSKKDGIDYDPPLIEERDIEVNNIYKYMLYYKNFLNESVCSCF